MDHIVYCDKKAKELSRLLSGEQTMVIRGAAGRKLPHGRVAINDTVYLLENDGSGIIRAKGKVSSVVNSEKLSSEESERIIVENMKQLKLTEAQKKRWIGKRYLCLVGLNDIHETEPFSYVREKNMDDWIIVDSIEDIKK
ncbi:MAG TPA: hypothetical protein GXZ70_10495 [Clostridiales bacterium]|nr:hypothetical protein [Clostridiales bacterium]